MNSTLFLEEEVKSSSPVGLDYVVPLSGNVCVSASV